MIMKLLQFVSCLQRVTITIVIAIIVSRWCSGCSCYCYCGVLVVLQEKDVMVARILIENVLALLLMIKDC